MEYVLIDEIRNGDIFTNEFDDKDEAIKYARDEWSRMSDHDKARRGSYYVLESINPDEEAVDHLDGNPVWDGMCTVVIVIEKWVEGSGIDYTTEYDTYPATSDLKWEDVDDAWSEELLDGEPIGVRFKVWYRLVDSFGQIIDESGYFWVEKDGE